MNNKFGGEVVIETISRRTGEVIDTYGPSRNMVLDQGASLLWQRLTKVDSNDSFKFSTIGIGTDFGDPSLWSEFNPEPPNRSMDETDQTAIYFTQTSNMTYKHPAKNVIQIVGLIDGVQAMQQSFPNQFDAEFTSATLRTGNNKAFAYKRFPARYITRDVDIRIIWTLTMQNARTFCGFQTPADSGITSIYVSNQNELIKIDTHGVEEWKYTPHAKHITALSADMSNYVYTGDETGLTQKNSNQRTLVWQNLQDNVDHPDPEMTGLVYDDRGNLYTSALNGEVKRLTENGGQIWKYEDTQDVNVYVYGVDAEYWAYIYNPAMNYLAKVDPNGVVENLDQGTHLSAIVDARVDSDGKSFTIDGDTLRVFSDIGDLLLEEPLPALANSIGVWDKNGIVIGYEDSTIRFYDYSAVEQWSTTLDSAVRFVEIDSDGVSYAGTSDRTVYKVDSSGNSTWTFNDVLAPIKTLTVDRTTT